MCCKCPASGKGTGRIKGIRSKLFHHRGTDRCTEGTGDCCSQYELGSGFSLPDLEQALAAHSYVPITRTRDILAEWMDREQHSRQSNAVGVTVPASCIKQIADSGLLIAVPTTGETLFLSNHLLDFDEDTMQYTLYLNPNMPYPIAPEKINPDVRISDQCAHQSIRGETLLRQMELANGVCPAVIEVQNTAIRSLSPKGLTLTLPEDGIDHLFIPSKFVSWDNLSNRVEISLYDNWHYSFKTQSGDQSVCGTELTQALSRVQPAPAAAMQRRIRAAERRAASRNLQYLNDILWTIKNEGIEKTSDFSKTLEELRGKVSAVDG